MLIGYQIRNHGLDGPQISVDEVKERLRREMVADFLEMNTGMMRTGMESKESLRREMMTEINRVLMNAGQDMQYLGKEMAAKVKTALKEERGENMNARDDFRRDPMSSVNIVRVGDVAPRRYVGKEVKVLDS
jgi:hypothetical protein